MSDGIAETRRAIAGADRPILGVVEGGRRRGQPPTDPADKDPCPVTCLGHLAGRYYFLDAKGQQVDLAARAVGNRHEMVSLFNGNDAWLRRNFPRKIEVKSKKTEDGQDIIGEDGKPLMETVEQIVDFNLNASAKRLMWLCGEEGLWGEHMQVRRPGIWPDGAGGIAVHCGNAVILGEDVRPAGHRSGNILWALAGIEARPGTPADASIAAGLQRDIQALFRFRKVGAAIMVMGLLGTAYFGGAPRWRSSGFLIGQSGCGKSVLLSILVACCPMHWYSNDTSKAGMEAGLDGRAMPSFIDENEKSGGNNDAAQNLLDLILTASGGKGTRGSRGGPDGRARRFEVVTSVIMAATAPPDMRETHLGRFAIIEMTKPESGEDNRVAHDALLRRATEQAPVLWGRALASWDRYGRALEAFRTELGVAGCAPREQDQLGAVLAGWWILTHEGDPDRRGTLEGVGAICEFVRTAEVVAEDSNGRRLVQYLMTKAITLDRSTAREPIGSLIERILQVRLDSYAQAFDQQHLNIGADTATRALGTHGIRVVAAGEQLDRNRGPVPCLSKGGGIWLNPRSTELGALFTQSDWAGPRWIIGLQELPGCRRSSKAVRVGSVASKALWLPLAVLQLGEGDNDPEDQPPDG